MGMAEKIQKKSLRTKTDYSDQGQIGAFIETMELLRSLDSEFPIQHAISLGIISLNPGLSLTQLADKTELTLSTVSRIVGALSDHRANGNPHYLIEVKVSKTERRKKELYLTKKGKAFLKKIENCF